MGKLKQTQSTKAPVLNDREKRMQAAMSKAIRELKKEASAKNRKLVVYP